jgi:hypothetical protein
LKNFLSLDVKIYIKTQLALNKLLRLTPTALVFTRLYKFSEVGWVAAVGNPTTRVKITKQKSSLKIRKFY